MGFARDKSQFLMSGVSWLSNDLRVLFFSSLDSLDEFIMPLVPFLLWGRIINDAGNPFGLPSWYSFQGLFLFFLRNDVQGQGKGRENGFLSSICFFKMYGSTGRESISFLEEKKKKTEKWSNFQAWYHLSSKTKEPQDKEKLEWILCVFLLKILHGTRSLAVRVCVWSFSGLGCERNPCFP